MAGVLESYRRLDRNVHLVALSKFIMAFSDFIIPFLGLYLVYRQHLSAGLAGVVITALSITYIPAVMVGGKVAHRIGRVGLAGLLLVSAACYVFIPFVGPIAVQLALLAIGRFALVVTEPKMNVLVNSSCAKDDKKVAFSLLYLTMNLGFAAGPLVAGFLFKTHTSLIFVLDACGKALVALLVLAFLDLGVGDEPAQEAPLSSYREVLEAHQALLWFAVGMVVFNFVYAQMDFSLPVFLQAVFPKDGALYFGYVMTINAITVLALTPLVTRATHRLRSFAAISVAGVLFSLGFGAYFFVRTFLAAALCTVLWSVGEILYYTNMNVYLAERYGDRDFGMTSSFVTGIARLGVYLNPLLAGWAIGAFGVRTIWPIVSAFTLANTAWLFLSRPWFDKAGSVTAPLDSQNES